ncbi:MAG TPA: hypothetical protein VJT73_02165, partial [Polyangiaceae bacterium]|nr:hypothetical protein [Polyangiaceae bacterium]
MSAPDQRPKVALYAVLGASGTVALVALGYIWGAGAASASASVSVPSAVSSSVTRPRSATAGEHASPELANAGPRESQEPEHPPVPTVPDKTPIELRDEKVAELKASGPGAPELLKQARDASVAWTALAAKKKMAATFDDWECYAAGCYTRLVQSSAADIEKFTHFLSQSREFSQWPGGKLRTGP